MAALDDVEKLRAALDAGEVVEVRRSIRRVSALEGFVVGLGQRWLLLHVVDDVVLDGYAAVRLADVRKVKTRAGEGSFTLRALAHNRDVAQPLPAVNLDTLAGVLEGLQQTFPLVGLFCENEHPDECHIGRVAGVSKRNVRLVEIDPQAKWAKTPTKWELSALTRIDAGGRYESALAALGADST